MLRLSEHRVQKCKSALTKMSNRAKVEVNFPLVIMQIGVGTRVAVLPKRIAANSNARLRGGLHERGNDVA